MNASEVEAVVEPQSIVAVDVVALHVVVVDNEYFHRSEVAV